MRENCAHSSPCDEVRGNVEDFMAGLGGLVSANNVSIASQKKSVSYKILYYMHLS